MAATDRSDWRSRRPQMYPSSSYDSYYGGPGSEGPPPSYPTSYGTPRGGGPPPHHSSQLPPSPMVSRGGEPDYYYYHDRPLSPGFGAPPPSQGNPYERQPLPPDGTPYRGRSIPTHRSQVIHRGTPSFSTRGGSVAAGGTPRSAPHHLRYVDARHPGGPPQNFFPESPFARSRNPGTPHLWRRQHLTPTQRNSGTAPWEPPSPNYELHKKPSREPNPDESEQDISRTPSKGVPEQGCVEGEDKGGDPLALLAKVSSDMENKPGQKSKKKQDAKKHASSAPPTSPLRRTTRNSPVITPTTDNTSSNKRRAEMQIRPSFPEIPPPHPPLKGPKAVTPMPAYFPPYGEDPRAPPPLNYSGPPPSAYQPYPSHRGVPSSSSWQRDKEPPHPAVVERYSFDSHDSGMSYESNSVPHRRYYGPPPPPQSSFDPISQQDWPRSPVPPGPVSMPGPPGGYPPRYMYGPPPHPPRPSDPYNVAPYSYAQQSQLMEEKTVLRRKFSWKHYPELERFLISHRDDYLEHSSKNYTAEQKQYNNWLTERLLAVAEQNNYIFDPEDFNFVSIRDRIRCYYKSYVQTARKRGMELPGKAHIKKHRPTNSLDKYAEEKDKRLREHHEDDGDSAEDEEKEDTDSSSKSDGEGSEAKEKAKDPKQG